MLVHAFLSFRDSVVVNVRCLCRDVRGGLLYHIRTTLFHPFSSFTNFYVFSTRSAVSISSTHSRAPSSRFFPFFDPASGNFSQHRLRQRSLESFVSLRILGLYIVYLEPCRGSGLMNLRKSRVHVYTLALSRTMKREFSKGFFEIKRIGNEKSFHELT